MSHLAWFRAYAERRLNSRLIDERRTIPPYVVLDLGNQGFLGLQAPRELGGLGLNTLAMTRALEQVAAVDLTLALLLGIHNGLGLHPILRHLPALAPPLAAGRELAGFALTEAAAGSNPLAIETRAERTDGGWLVTGEKQWIGLGSWAGVLVVIARAPQGPLALAVTADKLSHGPEALTMGVRGLVQNVVKLEAAFVPDSHVLGQPGAGLAVAKEAMNLSRLGIAAVALGGLKRCAQLMARYAQRRQVGTGLLLDNAVTLRLLEDVVSATAALEALVHKTATLVDEGRAPEEAYLVCKIAGPELLGEAVDRLMQLLGGRGYIEANGVPRLYRDARLLRIFEGPTEPLAMHLGALALLKPRGWRALVEEPAALEAALKALPPGNQQWTDYQAGLLTAYAVLGDARRFARVRREALEPYGEPEAAALLAAIAGYSAEVGDVEQSLPGEDQDLDPYLRKH